MGANSVRRSSEDRVALKDPSKNPYASKNIQSFTDIKTPEVFVRALTDMNFIMPTQIQAHSLPAITDKKRPNIYGQAKAGSGKTAAFGIGMLYWTSTKISKPQAVCFCPTRELAIQVHEVVTQLAKYTGHSVFRAIPGCHRDEVTDHVVVGTPGKMYYSMFGGQ